MSAMTSQITSLMIVYPTIYSGANQRKHQSSASLAFVRGIHRSPMNSQHKGPVTWKMFPFDDVIIYRWTMGVHFVSILGTNDCYNRSYCICCTITQSRSNMKNLYVTYDIIHTQTGKTQSRFLITHEWWTKGCQFWLFRKKMDSFQQHILLAS